MPSTRVPPYWPAVRRSIAPAHGWKPPCFADVTPEMRAYAEEIFGPVAVVYKVKDADEAIELANSSPFGLGGSVFGADEAAALISPSAWTPAWCSSTRPPVRLRICPSVASLFRCAVELAPSVSRSSPTRSCRTPRQEVRQG